MPGSTNLVRFHKKWLQHNVKTLQAGHPVGEEFDYIEIRGLGQDKTVMNRKVQDKDFNEYPREWDLYQKGQEQVAEGTPLREWPSMNEAEIIRLNSYAVYTIEALAVVNDAGLQQIGPGARELQNRAKYYLEDAVPKAAAANMAVQNDTLRAENEVLQTRLSRLEAQMLEMAEDEPAKRGPGRPKKAA